MSIAFAILLAAPAAPIAAEPPAAVRAAPADVQMDHISIRSIGAGDPVVLIPGLASPRAVYDGIAGELAKTHRVLLVQVNGFGGDAPGSNRQPGIIDGVTRDIVAYLERERLPKAAVIGHSMGGVVGMKLARDHCDRVGRLLIVDALPFIGTLFMPGATVETLRPAAEAMRSALLAAAGQPRQPSPDDPNVAIMSITPEGRRQVSAWGVAADPQVVGQALFEDLQADLRPDLAAIAKVPTTVLYAVPPQLAEHAHQLWRGAYAAAPSVRMVPVENSYHFIMLDQPERFKQEVATFLAAR